MEAGAVIVAGGRGSRFGGQIPKQFLHLGEKPLWKWSYDTLNAHPSITEVVLVVPDKFDREDMPTSVKTVIGGENRSDSVLNGLSALSISEKQPVLIHDAARPGLTGHIIDRLLDAIKVYDCAAPALPVVDALKRKTTGLETVNRTNLFRVQTPQVFKLGRIQSALQNHSEAFVDDLAAIEALGGSAALIEGSETLGKITHAADFVRMENLLLTTDIRVGSGYDVHEFEPGDKVTLCGVEIEHAAKLKGHSDADVGWHALTDAILGALALGDIGDHFPPSEAKWKNAASSIFLKHSVALAEDRGFTINNLDITLICEEPKIKPHREAMQKATAECVGVTTDRVSIKATTTEGLGFTGRKEGIAAQASVTLAGRKSALSS